MTDEEVLRNLCYYDPRNPEYEDFAPDERYEPRDNCSCDNCFYRRDPLAIEILRLRQL